MVISTPFVHYAVHAVGAHVAQSLLFPKVTSHAQKLILSIGWAATKKLFDWMIYEPLEAVGQGWMVRQTFLIMGIGVTVLGLIGD